MENESCACIVAGGRIVSHCADGRWLWYLAESAGFAWAREGRSFAQYQQARQAYDEHVERAIQRAHDRRQVA